MATVRELINGSLRLINAVSSGETPSAEESADALFALNELVIGWGVEGLLIPQLVREEFSLVAGTASYTIGASGTFNTIRPLRIVRATIELQGSTPTQEHRLDIITPAEWAEIQIKDLGSDIPTKLYMDPGNPLATLYLYPKPTAAEKIVLYSEKPITEFASLNTEIDLQPGYKKALRYNLAVELAPEYGKDPSAVVATIAVDTKASLNRINSNPRFLAADEAVRGRSRFDIWKGE